MRIPVVSLVAALLVPLVPAGAAPSLPTDALLGPLPPFVVQSDTGPMGFVLARDPVLGTPVYRPGVVGGNGTASDPFAVEGGWSSLVVQGTRSHVVFRDVTVKSVPLDLARIVVKPVPACVTLQGASNVTFERGSLCPIGEVVVAGSSDVRFEGTRLEGRLTCFDSRGVTLHGVSRDPTYAPSRLPFVFERCADVLLEESRLSYVSVETVGGAGFRLARNVLVNDSEVYLVGTAGVRLDGNEVRISAPRHGSAIYGNVVDLVDTPGAVLRDNLLGRGLRVRATTPAGCAIDADGTNLVRGLPVWVGTGPGAVAPAGAGQVILCGTEGALVEGLGPSDPAERVTVLHSRNATVRDADLGRPDVGVHVEASADVVLRNVTWTHNDTRTGTMTLAVGVWGVDAERILVDASLFRGSPVEPYFTRSVLLEGVRDAEVRGTRFESGGTAVSAWGARGVRVADNTMEGQFYAVDLRGGADVTVEGNVATACVSACASIDGVTDGTLRGNRFSGDDDVSHAIFVWDATRLLVERNTLRADETALLAVSAQGLEFRLNDARASTAVVLGPSAQTASVHHNNFGGNVAGVDAAEDARVVAEHNWWGCPTGPGTPGCDRAFGDVDADPWLTEPAADAGAP